NAKVTEVIRAKKTVKRDTEAPVVPEVQEKERVKIKVKYLAREKDSMTVKLQTLARQETECQTKVTLAEADQRTAEAQAAALALEARTAQTDLTAKQDAQARAKQLARQDAPKEVKAKRAVELKAAEEALEQARVAAKAKVGQASAAKTTAEDKAKVTSRAQAALAKQRKSMADQKADLEVKADKNAERQANAEIKANQVAAQAKHDAELKAAAELARRSALEKQEAKARAEAEEQARKEAELKARAEAKKAAMAAEAARKAAAQKLFEDTKSKYLTQAKSVIAEQLTALARQETECQAKVTLAEADQRTAEAQAAALAFAAEMARADLNAKVTEVIRAKKTVKRDTEAPVVPEVQEKEMVKIKVKYLAREKDAMTVKLQTLARQETECQTKVTLAEADQRTAEAQAAALALAAETARADLNAKIAEVTRAKKMVKQDAPKNVKVQRALEAQAAEKAREQAELSYRTALAKASAAKRIAVDKAEAISDAKAALVKQRKRMAAQKADWEAEALKNAERQAKDEIKAKQIAEKKIAEDKKSAEKARRDAELTVLVMGEKKAAALAKQKAKQADAAKEIAAEKAKATSNAKAALLKQQKCMIRQKADMEAEMVKNAERQAKAEIKANQIAAKARYDAEMKADKAARQKAAEDLSRRDALAKAEARARQAEQAEQERKVKVKARVKAHGETVETVTPAIEAEAIAGKPVAVATKDIEKEKWRLAVGMFVRQIGAQRFKTGSYSASYVGTKSARDHWVGAAGGLNDVGNRIYDDGYVKADDYTDLDNGTWNWGYDDGKQVKGNSIEFEGVDERWRRYSRHMTATEAENRENADYRGGIMLEAARYLAQTRFIDYGLSFGLSRAQTFQASANGLNNFNDLQEWSTYESYVLDTYDITGLGITPDSEPYHGNANKEGPVIDASPMTRQHLGSDLVSAQSYQAYNSISESFDMDLSTLSLGMSVKSNYRRVYVVGSTGPTLNMVEKDANYNETLFESYNGRVPQAVKYWNDSASGTECLFGYYVQAEVGVRIYRGLHLGIFGRYDWLENVSGDVGPARYEVNPSGGSMGGTLGLQF
ncbi:MAG: hypothetical protein ABIH24_06820, partial [Verrucomicrobiota bacterium]